MLERLNVKLIGDVPLMFHNGRLADPTNKWTIALKKLTANKKKTEADMLEIRKLEWFGGMYEDHEGRVAVPADCVLAVVLGGARKSKDGKETEVGVFAAEPFFRLEYDGPKDMDKLYADGRFDDYRSVVVSQKRVMRCRPIFPQWALPVALDVNTDIIDIKKVVKALEMAGERVGLCEHRPRYGRFHVEVN